jgi:uncharacterized protein with gpF-like domain
MKKIFELIKKLLGGGSIAEKTVQLNQLEVEVKKEVAEVKEEVAEVVKAVKEKVKKTPKSTTAKAPVKKKK